MGADSPVARRRRAFPLRDGSRNIFRGFSPLAAVMREVYIDDQAANFTAAILKNLGIIGVIFSPKEGTIPKEQAEALKNYVQSNFTGDKRAQAMMFTGAMTRSSCSTTCKASTSARSATSSKSG
jgi:hypothetical protein